MLARFIVNIKNLGFYPIFGPLWGLFLFGTQVKAIPLPTLSPIAAQVLGGDVSRVPILSLTKEPADADSFEILNYLVALSPPNQKFVHFTKLWRHDGANLSNLDLLGSYEPFWSLLVVDNPAPIARTMVLYNDLPIVTLSMTPFDFDPQQALEWSNLEVLKNTYHRQVQVNKSFTVKIPPGRSYYLIGLTTRDILTIIFPKLVTETRFKIIDLYRNLLLIALYGGLVGLCVYNFTLIIAVKFSNFAYFLLSAIGITGIITSLFGLPIQVNFLSGWNGPTLWVFWITLVVFSICKFSLVHFEHIKEISPRFYTINYYLDYAPILVGLLYYISHVFGLLIPILIMVQVIVGFYSILRFGLPGSRTDALILLLSGFPLGLSGIYLSFQYLGIIGFQPLAFFLFMIIALLFLVLFSLNIGSFNLTQKVTTEKIRTSLELAQKVQSLLHPGKKDGQMGQYQYAYELNQRVSTLSGDWVYFWHTKDHNFHVIVGEVAGEGPHVALVVAAIYMALERLKRTEDTVLNNLKVVNQTLFQMFSGKATATATGFSLTKNGALILTHAGGDGVFHQRSDSIRHLGGMGPLLGQRPVVELPIETNSFTTGDRLIIMSKCLNSLHQQKGPLTHDKGQGLKQMTPIELCRHLSANITKSVGKNHAVLVVSAVA